MSDDEDSPQLSTSTLTALQEFYAEQAAREIKYDINITDTDTTIFDENWQLSQFWYSDDTAQVLANEALRLTAGVGGVALISCPTIYPKIKKLSPGLKVILLEYDKRFAVYEGFIYYDYKKPLNIPNAYHEAFDIVIADPPFLSKECLTSVSKAVKFLANDKIILCTGAVMEDLAKQLLNVEVKQFQPKHQSNLANEFRCYANYDIDKYILKTESS